MKQDPYHQIEYFLTMNFLAKYMPEKGLILDAGGGPGRYAIELARRGYEVILFDLVPEMLKLAERKIRRAGLKRRVKKCFAYEAIKSVGIEKTYDCGIFERIRSWIDAAGVKCEFEPLIGKCLKVQGKECRRTIPPPTSKMCAQHHKPKCLLELSITVRFFRF